jgi:hypothetical protein
MSTTTKYCKVCQDAGKPESEYRSHFTRESKDPNSKVCCPTLLALECRYCFKAGHTIKYCKVLKDNEKNKKRWELEAKNKKHIIEKEKNNSNKKVVTNKFAYLDDDDSENELEEHISNNEEFPELIKTPVTNIKITSNSNYANALTSKDSIPLPSSIPVRMTPLTNKKRISEINWAAMDSDDEDEDDNYSYVQETYNNYDEKHCDTYATAYDEDW